MMVERKAIASYPSFQLIERNDQEFRKKTDTLRKLPYFVTESKVYFALMIHSLVKKCL